MGEPALLIVEHWGVPKISKAMNGIRGAVSFLLLVVLISFGISPAATANGGHIWTSRSAAANNTWSSVTYGNGLFVAVSASGTGNRVMTSPDGITWTSRSSAADINWQSVTYGNGLFVAVSLSGTGNRVMTSPDGITWASRSSAADNSWRSVTYGDGLFVAVSSTGTGNRVMTSPDGITWTIRSSAADNTWSVTYGNGLFVAVSSTGTGDRVMTAPSSIVPDAPVVVPDAPVYVYVPPMNPIFAPSIVVNNGVITCTIGEYSRAATSVAFSLFVDGNHLSTNFSAAGDYLPSWIAVWADPSTIQRTASLTSASWDIGVVGKGSRASCWTLAYSQHATGLISSGSISLPGG